MPGDSTYRASEEKNGSPVGFRLRIAGQSTNIRLFALVSVRFLKRKIWVFG